MIDPYFIELEGFSWELTPEQIKAIKVKNKGGGIAETELMIIGGLTRNVTSYPFNKTEDVTLQARGYDREGRLKVTKKYGLKVLVLKDSPAKSSEKIVLEIGHGTRGDPGAIDNRTGTTEHSLNIIVADRAKERLTLAGYSDVEVTDDWSSLWNIGYKESRDASVFVSIHHNAHKTLAQGSECLYSPKGNEDDIRLASIISARCARALNITNRGAKKMGLSVLSGATYDRYKGLEGAVLAEGFFITGELNGHSLKDLALSYGDALAEGIIEFLEDV